MLSTFSWKRPRGSYRVTSARASTRMPSAGSQSSAAARPRNMTQSTWAVSSFRVKYQWPEEAGRKLEISPPIQASGKRRSSTSRTLRSSSETLSTGAESRGNSLAMRLH